MIFYLFIFFLNNFFSEKAVLKEEKKDNYKFDIIEKTPPKSPKMDPKNRIHSSLVLAKDRLSTGVQRETSQKNKKNNRDSKKSAEGSSYYSSNEDMDNNFNFNEDDNFDDFLEALLKEQ